MRVVLDLETASTADLRLTGAQAYAEHPDTRITVLCYAIGDGPVITWTSGAPMPDFIAAIRAGAMVVAHNYLFEFNVYHQKLVPLGWPEIPLAQWSCTMARCLVAGFPASLEHASRAAKLAIPKDTGARDLMLRMARPRTTEPLLTWWHETSPDHLKRLSAYCATDVEAERLLDKAIPALSPRERAIFEADHDVNQRGLHVDVNLVRRLSRLAGQAKALSADALRVVTAGEVSTPNQVLRLRTWLAQQDVACADLRRPTVYRLLQDNALSKSVRKALQARFDVSRSSTAKLTAILAARSQDGRVRGCFQYYGANRTGRWAGRRLQPQNLFRGSIKDIAAALLAVQHDAEVDELGLLFEDSAMGVIASCLRSTIQAPGGYTLVVMDFSQIEARVLAWLANEAVSLSVFAAGEDIYTATAARVGSSSRQLGKVLVLACGYGMGAWRFMETAATFGVILDIDACIKLVTLWRQANARIVTFWWDCDRAMRRVIGLGDGAIAHVGKCAFIRRRGALDAVLVRLPSGRHLVYRYPRLEDNDTTGHTEVTYMGSMGGGWTRLRTWPGKIAENITQAVARDAMADALVALHRVKVPLVATVHDELIAEVPLAQAPFIFDLMKDLMSQTPLWAPGLPMAADGFIARRYMKK